MQLQLSPCDPPTRARHVRSRCGATQPTSPHLESHYAGHAGSGIYLALLETGRRLDVPMPTMTQFEEDIRQLAATHGVMTDRGA